MEQPQVRSISFVSYKFFSSVSKAFVLIKIRYPSCLQILDLIVENEVQATKLLKDSSFCEYLIYQQRCAWQDKEEEDEEDDNEGKTQNNST